MGTFENIRLAVLGGEEKEKRKKGKKERKEASGRMYLSTWAIAASSIQPLVSFQQPSSGLSLGRGAAVSMHLKPRQVNDTSCSKRR
jgi:hypothetical protein